MKRISILIPYLFVLLLGAIDHITGYEVSFSIFYLLPILIVTWYYSIIRALFISLFSAATWLTADLTSGHTYSHIAIPLWNTLMRFCFFGIIVLLAKNFQKELAIEKELGRKDILTGIANYRGLTEQISVEKNRALRFNRPMSIAYIDIDNFKQENDIFGHAEGDTLLHLIAKNIKNNVRAYDIVARVGGDEFIIVLPETNSEQAQTALKKVQNNLLDLAKKHAEFITFSIGIVTYNRPAYSTDEMIKMADNVMYSIKNNGKNAIGYEIIK